MAPPAQRSAPESLLQATRSAVTAADALLADASAKVRAGVVVEGHVVSRLIDREQHAVHGLAWLATYVEAIRQLNGYAERLSRTGQLGEIEEHIIRIGTGEYLSQIVGGIPMSQNEMVRPSDYGLSASQVAARFDKNVDELVATGNTAERRARLVALMADNQNATVGVCGLDETLELVRDEMRKFADSEVIPRAQDWHRTNSYIPMEVIRQMSELGVFGLTIPEEYGGMGLGKESMCVVSEELSRGYIGVGSLGHPVRDRSRAHSQFRHRSAKEQVAAEDRVGRDHADRGFHRTEYRLRSGFFEDTRGPRCGFVQGVRQQDLDHASGACRPDDAAGPYQSERAGASRSVHAVG